MINLVILPLIKMVDKTLSKVALVADSKMST